MLKKIILFLIFIVALVSFAKATQITITGTTFQNWRYGGTTATLRVFANNKFLTNTGVVIIPGGIANGGSWYLQVTCTIVSTTITCPNFILDSTVNSSLPTATYTAAFYDHKNIRRDYLFQSWKVPSSASSITFNQLLSYQETTTPTLPVTYYTSGQIDILLGTFASTSYVDNQISSTTSTLTDLITSNSLILTGEQQDQVSDIINPLLSTKVNTDDTRLERDLSQYGGSLATAISTIGATKVTLNISEAMTQNTAAVPRNICLKVVDNGFITINASQTLSIGCLVDPGNKQIFNSAAAGASVSFLKGAVKVINIAWYSGNNGGSISDSLQEAVSNASSIQATVYIPSGAWTSSGAHEITGSGVEILGDGNSPSSGIGPRTVLTLTSPSTTYLFKIGQNIYGTRFKKILLDGTGTSSKYGVLVQGTGGIGTTSGDLKFEEVTFQAFDRGFNYNSLGASWQLAQVMFDQCIFQNNTTGAYLSSVNSQFTFNSTNAAVPNSGYGLYILASGPVSLKGAEFAATPGGGATAIRITGSHGVIALENYQDEGFATTLQNDASDFYGIISIKDSLIQSKILLNQSCIVNSFSSNYLSNAFQDAAPAVAIVNSFGDRVRAVDVTTTDGITPIVSPPNLANFTAGSILNEIYNSVYNSNFAMPLIIATSPSLSSNITDPVLQVLHYNPAQDKPQIRFGRSTINRVAEYYYDLGRSNTGNTAGRAYLRGNQIGFTGFDVEEDLYVSGAIRGQTCQLTDAATITIDPRCANVQTVTLGGNRTFNFNTFSSFEQTRADGQKLTLEIKQDGTGSRTCTLTTGANDQFIFGTDIGSITCTVTAAKTDLLTVQYSSRARRWMVIDFKKGF